VPLEHDLVMALNAELLVHFEESGEGNATLSGSSSGQDFHWCGPAGELLERLRKVPPGGGAEGVRSEFS
jgi:hypothetical protein